MKAQKSERDLINYNPYSIGRQKDGYADIAFEDEGSITVPRQSASSIVDLLNSAFKNGVKMAINYSNKKNYETETPEFIPKQMPKIEPIPINSYVKKK